MKVAKVIPVMTILKFIRHLICKIVYSFEVSKTPWIFLTTYND